MKVTMIHGTNYDGMATLVIDVDGKEVIHVHPLNECPEDAYLERKLGFAYDIPELMRKAYEAGKDGEEFVLEEIEE